MLSRSFVFLLLFISEVGFCQTAVDKKDMGLKRYSCYLQKEVSQFLSDDSIRNFKRLKVVSEPPGVLGYLRVKLEDSLYARIFFDSLKFQNRFNENMNWDIQLLFKEQVSRIIFCREDDDFKCTEVVK